MSSLASDHSSGSRPGLFIRTYGCQMNEYDSEKLAEMLSGGYSPVETAEQAELVIVNTCSVREKAENKLYSLLGTLRQLKERQPKLVIGVSGCVAQQEGAQIAKRNRAVDFVVGTHNLSLVPSLVERVKEGRGQQIAVDYREDWEDLPTEISEELSAEERYGILAAGSSQVRALVAIQRGCNKNCTFCVVPNTRGPEVSRAPDEILRETRLKVMAGAKEVLLLGQTVNSYGRDLEPRYPFEELIARLAEIDGLERIRFTSPHPAEVRPGFIRLYGEVPQLCPHIHLPLQSGSDRILKLMNRNYRKARYLQIVEALKEQCPEIAITTDIIVGFPTESDEDFEETLEVMRAVRFHSSYSFKYSVRPNTVAQEKFSKSELVDESLAHRRLLELQRLQDQISQEINSEKLGKQVEILVEGRGKKISSAIRGRTPENTLVELAGGLPETGQLVIGEVERATPHGLRARLSERGVGA